MNRFPIIWFMAMLAISCNKGGSLFENPDPKKTGLDFTNTLTSTKDLSILDYLYFYNGGGVSIGDINNDGLPDIFFTGNQVKNKLYLNKGNLEFEDISSSAGIEGNSGDTLGQRINGTCERIVLADELRDEGILGLFIQRHRRVELLDHAVIEHGDAVRHGQRLGLVVRHIDDGHTQIFVDVLDFILHMLAKLLVERAKRFVHQYQFRFEHQRPRQRDPLLLAT